MPGALAVPFDPFCFGVPLLKLNIRKKGTLISFVTGGIAGFLLVLI